LVFNTNCKHWRGDKPCKENRLCDGCKVYAPLGERILLIKLGARGDVLRTTPLLAGLRRVYPRAHVTWLTAPEAAELLQGVPGLDRLLSYGPESVAEVLARKFELVVCLDKEAAATGLAALAQAPRKLGWGLAPDGAGTPCALNPEAEYSLALGVSDELKFKRNTKTYLQIIFAAAGLPYAGERYAFALTDEDRARSRAFFKRHGIKPGAQVLGLFTGCGAAFTRKRWTEKGLAALARKAERELGARVLLMAGPGERDLNARIRRLARLPLLDTRGEHSLRELGGFLEACRAVVTGDTVALHLALALARPTVALFGPTCSQEIDMFGLGEKVSSQLACMPCYRRTCGETPTCMEALPVESVWQALRRVWQRPA
jgi:ADP-heptose:LPS heptosyltransferase